MSGALLGVSPDGRNVEFGGPDGKPVKSKVSGSRTKITIGGQDSSRKKLKVGMMCDVTYDPRHDKNEPSVIACK